MKITHIEKIRAEIEDNDLVYDSRLGKGNLFYVRFGDEIYLGRKDVFPGSFDLTRSDIELGRYVGNHSEFESSKWKKFRDIRSKLGF